MMLSGSWLSASIRSKVVKEEALLKGLPMQMDRHPKLRNPEPHRIMGVAVDNRNQLDLL